MGTRGKESKPNSGWRIQVHYFKAFLVVCGLMVVITLIYFACVAFFFGVPEDGAGFGDMFGGLSSVFAGLAFAGVLITVIMQQEELRETREELRKAAEAQDSSQKALNEQVLSMQISNRIETLNTYTKTLTVGSKFDQDKAKATRAIVHSLAQEILSLPQYASFVEPIFKFHDLRVTSRYKGIPKHFYIDLLNVGGGAVVILNEKDLSPGIKLPANYEEETFIKGGEILTFMGFEELSDSKAFIELVYTSSIVPGKFLQKLTVEIIGTEVVYSLTEREVLPFSWP